MPLPAAAGISQPYLFRLFGTKKDLFVATFNLVGDRIINEFTRAADGLEGQEAKEAMGQAYLELMQDPEMLQVQLHGFAAAPGDPDIARACRRMFEELQQLAYERAHLTDEEVREFFATGMLINVMAAIDLLSVPDSWAQNLCAVPEKTQAVMAATQALEAHHRADRAESAEVPA